MPELKKQPSDPFAVLNRVHALLEALRVFELDLPRKIQMGILEALCDIAEILRTVQEKDG